MSVTGIDYICFGLLAPKLVLVEVLMLLLVAQICDDLHWPLLQHPGPFLHLLCVGGPALPLAQNTANYPKSYYCSSLI